MSSTLPFQLHPASPSPCENRYQYEPLPTQSSFRVVELLRGHPDDDICYTLHLAEIGRSKHYEALSYTWNDPDIRIPSYCNGMILQVTPNLHAALKALRKLEESTWLWVDAISINQEDVAERSEQVRHMLDIYRNSTRVIVWLGPDEKDDTGDSKALKAKILIDEIAAGLLKLTGHLLWADPDQFSVTEFPELSQPMPLEKEERTQLVLHNLHKIEDLSPFTQQNERTFYSGHPHLPALSWLFSRPWFERMWVVQEVNAIANITVLCGDVAISWDWLGLAAAFIPQTWFDIEDKEIDTLFEGTFIRNADKMRHRSALRSWNVYQIMSYTSEFRATDPRDQVYGKLGLRPFARSGLRVEPDYDKSVRQVYMDFAISGMNHFQDLDVLTFAGFGNAQRDDIPSWVPLWDKNLVMRSILVQFGNWNWKADGGERLEKSIKVHNDSLFVKGVVLDRILRSIYVDSEGWRPSYAKNKQNSLYQLWQQECRGHGPEFNSSSRIEDSRFLGLAASIVAGVQNTYQRITDDWAGFQNKVTSFMNLSVLDETGRSHSASSESEEAWFHYRWHAHVSTAERVLFETNSGHVGLGPQSLQQDDLVCVLYGGKVPFILRSNGDHYELVGESYVHGFMDGEVIEMLRAGELKEQEFQIR